MRPIGPHCTSREHGTTVRWIIVSKIVKFKTVLSVLYDYLSILAANLHGVRHFESKNHMTDVDRLKSEFSKAKQALLSKLFDLDEPASEKEVQSVLDHMSRVFNELLISRQLQANQTSFCDIRSVL